MESAPASTAPKLSVLALVLTVVVALLNVGDVVLHVAIDQVEPLRVTGNAVVVVAALGMPMVAALRAPAVPITAAAVNLVLNTVFIAVFGIGPLGAVLIALTTVLLAAIAIVIRPSASR